MYWAGHPQARIGKDQQPPAETIFSRPGFITTDGLYRISGSHSDVQTIKQEIDKVSSLYPVSLADQIRGQVSVCRAWNALPNNVEHKVEAIVEPFRSPAGDRTWVP